MKKLGFSFPLVQYEKDEQIDVSEAWSLDEKRNVQVTSTIGYVPLEKRISAMIKAGITLEDMKEEYYGIDDDDELDLVQDYDSKIELMRSCKERSERLVESLKGKKRTSVQDQDQDQNQEKENPPVDNPPVDKGKKQTSVQEKENPPVENV